MENTIHDEQPSTATRKCLHCGSGIVSKRKDKKFCSNICRAKHSAKNKLSGLGFIRASSVKLNNNSMTNDDVIYHYKYLYQQQLARSEALQKDIDILVSEKFKRSGGLNGLLESETGQQLIVALAPSLGKIAENLTSGMKKDPTLDYISQQPDEMKNTLVMIVQGFEEIPIERRTDTMKKIIQLIKSSIGNQSPPPPQPPQVTPFHFGMQ